jgi:hypothetical protein
MNKLLVILIFLSSFSCSKSQDKGSDSWAAITYNLDGGQILQGYQNNYSVIINSDKSCVFIYRFPENDLVRNFSIDKNALTKLSEFIIDAKILESEITTDPTYALSADMRSCQLVLNQKDNLDQPPRVIKVPFNPSDEFKDGLNNLYNFIETLIPGEAKTEFESKRDEYFKNKK